MIKNFNNYMELNKEKYKQIGLIDEFNVYHDFFKGKVVNKVGFTNEGGLKDNIFVITFTDNTYIAIGIGDSKSSGYKLRNFPITDNTKNFGNYYHDLKSQIYLDDTNVPQFSNSFVKILTDLGIWNMSPKDLQKTNEEIEKKEKEKFEHEEYLRLREKYDPNYKKIDLVRTGEDYSDMGAPHKIETYGKNITIRDLINFAFETSHAEYGGNIIIGPRLESKKHINIKIPYKHGQLCESNIPDEILNCIITKCSAFGSWGVMNYYIEEFEIDDKVQKIFNKLARK